MHGNFGGINPFIPPCWVRPCELSKLGVGDLPVAGGRGKITGRGTMRVD